MLYPVDNIADAYDACHPDTPLSNVQDSRYVDLTAVRGGENLVRAVANAIQRTRPPNFHQQLVTGHRGCGKSTEFFRLQDKLERQNYFVVYLDAGDMLDLGDIEYLDILTGIAKSLVAKLETQGIELNPELVKALWDWFATITLSQEQKTEREGKLGAGFKIPILSDLLLEITGHIRSGSKRRVEIRQVLEKESSVFIDRLNTLIDAARVELKKQGYVDLVVIVDQLEKMAYRKRYEDSNYAELFVHHAGQLKSPHCHILYTVPIDLVFSANLGDAFGADSIFVIPMVDAAKPPGREKLREIIARRVDIAKLFVDSGLVERLIGYSGGAVRDVMRLVRLACQYTEETIGPTEVEQAIRALVREYDRLVKTEDLDRLKQVDKEKRVDRSFADLLRLRIIHEYQNGERWADLHPAVREIAWVKRGLSGLAGG